MNLKRFAILASFLLITSGVAQAASQWLHVRVQKAEQEDESVRVNIPLSLVETVLPLVEAEELKGGKVQWEENEFTVSELREIWETLKQQGDYELASVQSKGSTVRIVIEGDYLLVRAAEGSASDVSVTIPTRVVDALLSGAGEELDIVAAVQALADSGVDEIVSVQDEDTNVRIWIDGSSKGD